jgi:hypothetical protein
VFNPSRHKIHRGSTGHSGQQNPGFDMKGDYLSGDATFLQRLLGKCLRLDAGRPYLPPDVILKVGASLKVSQPRFWSTWRSRFYLTRLLSAQRQSDGRSDLQ